MTSKVNQRVKRKNEFIDAKSEPNMKSLKKKDIIARFSALQANYKILEKKNINLEEENISCFVENIHIKISKKKNRIQKKMKDCPIRPPGS